MMFKKVIYKYRLPEGGAFGFELPAICEPLHVGEWDGNLYLWVMVDPDSEKLMRTFYIRGTGIAFSSTEEFVGDYIGTAQMSSGLVWHVFSEYEF